MKGREGRRGGRGNQVISRYRRVKLKGNKDIKASHLTNDQRNNNETEKKFLNHSETIKQ